VKQAAAPSSEASRVIYPGGNAYGEEMRHVSSATIDLLPPAL